MCVRDGQRWARPKSGTVVSTLNTCSDLSLLLLLAGIDNCFLLHSSTSFNLNIALSLKEAFLWPFSIRC